MRILVEAVIPGQENTETWRSGIGQNVEAHVASMMVSMKAEMSFRVQLLYVFFLRVREGQYL